jgi:hypothetical protein
MDRNPFFPCLDASKALPVPNVLILGSLVAGLVLAGSALLFL